MRKIKIITFTLISFLISFSSCKEKEKNTDKILSETELSLLPYSVGDTLFWQQSEYGGYINDSAYFPKYIIMEKKIEDIQLTDEQGTYNSQKIIIAFNGIFKNDGTFTLIKTRENFDFIIEFFKPEPDYYLFIKIENVVKKYESKTFLDKTYSNVYLVEKDSSRNDEHIGYIKRAYIAEGEGAVRIQKPYYIYDIINVKHSE